MTEMSRFRTDNAVQREKRDLAIYAEYHRLIKEPGASRTKVDDYLCRKYGLHSRSTIWFIRKRVAGRIASGEVSL